MLICFGVLIPSPVQSQKVAIDRAQLIELTKKAEKAQFCEGETTGLIVENYNLKEKLKAAEVREKTANDRAEQLRMERNRLRFILTGIGLTLLGVVGIWLFKPKLF